MKKLILLASLIIIVILGLSVLSLIGNLGSNQYSVENNTDQCFLSTITNVSGTSTLAIKATLHSDGTVEGSLESNPSEKDFLSGPFLGTWKTSIDGAWLDVVQTYTAEGQTATTSRLITIKDGYALIDWDGIEGNGEISDLQIPRVSCEYQDNNDHANTKIDIYAVCQNALAYMTFSSGAEADAFVAQCVAGEHPEVIERYLSEVGVNDGRAI